LLGGAGPKSREEGVPRVEEEEEEEEEIFNHSCTTMT